MEIVFWILLCILAFLGAVELFGRLAYGFDPPKKAARGFIVVRLSNETALMREQMEYYLSWVEWNGTAGHTIVLVCEEDDTNAADMFERYLGDIPGVRLVAQSRLSGLLNGRL